jgi:hypothetical protein
MRDREPAKARRCTGCNLIYFGPRGFYCPRCERRGRQNEAAILEDRDRPSLDPPVRR